MQTFQTFSHKGNSYVKVEIGQIWKHTKSNTNYMVAGIENAGNALDDDNNPPIVIYVSSKGGRHAREILKWYAGFSYIGYTI